LPIRARKRNTPSPIESHTDQHILSQALKCPPFGFHFFHPTKAPPYAAPLPAAPTLRSAVKLYAVLAYKTGLDIRDFEKAKSQISEWISAVTEETWDSVLCAWLSHREAAYGKEDEEAVKKRLFRYVSS